MNANLERIVADLTQKVERRFYGKYRGLVIDNADPQQLGRLRVQVPSLLGPDVVTGWAMPCVPYGGAADQGFLFIPEVNAGVWVEFEEGDLEFPIWVGTFWAKPGGDSELPKQNNANGSESSIQNPPTRKIIKTLKGHTIQFEDNDGDEMIRIVDFNRNVITMDSNGITITDANKNSIAMDSSGISLTDATGNTIQMTTSAFNIISKKDFTIDASGQAVVIKANTIDMQKA